MEIREFHSQGAFGNIYLTRRSKNGYMIIKRVKANPNKPKESPREAFILKQISHPNIINLYFVKISKFGDFLIGLEYFNNLSLEDCILLGEKFSKERIRKILCQVVSVIKYLHSLNIVHGDIKTDNVLISIDSKIKFCDFGFSRFSNGKCSTKVGSLNYFPPEVLLEEVYNPFKADIWCTGILLHTLVYGSPPERNGDLGAILKTEEEFEEFNVFIRKMLEYDPELRWDIKEIEKKLHK